MVKRAIAVLAGAVAGTLLWFVFDAVTSARSEVDPSVDSCERGPLVDCVRYDVPAKVKPDSEAAAAVVAPCKGWLSGDNAGAALLSQCLHADRERSRAIAGST